MTFDPIAAAVDWLDAYRNRDLEAILKMYADDAVTECGCDGVTVEGDASLRTYWEYRLKKYPAFELMTLDRTTTMARPFFIWLETLLWAQP